MRAQTVDVRESAGRVLCCTIFRPSGRKLLAKGHVISDEDIQLLETEGLGQVWVTELEDGEVAEDLAVTAVAEKMGCGCIETRLAAGGRANLVATENCCVLVDDELLRQINCTSNIVIATSLNFSYAKAGARIASIKSAPFAVARAQLDAVLSILGERGPILQARPVRKPLLGVVYSDLLNGDRARQYFDAVMRQRLERFQCQGFFQDSVEEENALARVLRNMLYSRPSGILIASTTAPAGPEDAVGRAMIRIGCHLERFLAPVEPGNLLLLGYMDEVPILSAPGCFRSAKPNVVDLIIPPILSRYHLTGWEIGCLGHGGLLG